MWFSVLSKDSKLHVFCRVVRIQIFRSTTDDLMEEQMISHTEKPCNFYSTSDKSPAARSREHGKESSVPQETGNFFTNVATISFSRRIMLHGTSYWLEVGYTKKLSSSV
jgi:hypothetical protein